MEQDRPRVEKGRQLKPSPSPWPLVLSSSPFSLARFSSLGITYGLNEFISPDLSWYLLGKGLNRPTAIRSNGCSLCSRSKKIPLSEKRLAWMHTSFSGFSA